MTATARRTNSMPLRCVVVEDQLMFLELLVGLLRCLSGLEVVATATTAADGIRACRTLAPDLLVLDLALPDQDGISVLRELAVVKPDAQVIVLSANAKSFVCDASFAPMLHAVVDKLDSCESLAVEIAKLLGGPGQETRRLSGKKSARGADLSTSESILRVEHHGPRDRQMAVIESWSEVKD
ncbi:MAG: response regulator [Synechococcaceae cyanobacterium]